MLFFGGCLTLSVDIEKSNVFLHIYHKFQCILNMKSIFKGNVAIIREGIIALMSMSNEHDTEFKIPKNSFGYTREPGEQ